MGIVLLVIAIILFIGLVVAHELGHFWVARRNGVEAEEFGLFFPPTLYRKRMKSGFDLTFNLLPLGGYVKLKGEHDSDTKKGSFGAANDWSKTKIMLAGVFVNLVLAVVLFTVLAWAGMPKLIDNQFTIKPDTKTIKQELLTMQVVAGSPADKAGLKTMDSLESITDNSGRVTTLPGKNLSDITKKHAGQTVTLKYKRDGEAKQTKISLLSEKAVKDSQKTKQPKGYMGIATGEYTLQRSTWSAPVVAVGLTGQLTGLTFKGLGQALGGLGSMIAGAVTGNEVARSSGAAKASEQVSGPVGIFMVLKAGSTIGLNYVLLIIALISLTLAIMNILPIPALDGGRLYMMLLSRLTKRGHLSQKAEENIVAASFLLLLALILLITVVDVRRFF